MWNLQGKLKFTKHSENFEEISGPVVTSFKTSYFTCNAGDDQQGNTAYSKSASSTMMTEICKPVTLLHIQPPIEVLQDMIINGGQNWQQFGALDVQIYLNSQHDTP